MKTIFNLLLFVLTLLASVPQGHAQVVQPTITTRFAFQEYNPVSKKLKLAVELQSDQINQQVYGINVRFFYDAVMMLPGSTSTVDFVDFAPGYTKFSPNPPYFGTGTAGIAWFRLSGTPVTFVNGAIAKTNISAPPTIINTSGWTRLFSIVLTTRVPLTGDDYPVVIWDRKTTINTGGFMPGAAGNVITVILDPSGIIKTGPAYVKAVNYNWKAYPGATIAPWGQPFH